MKILKVIATSSLFLSTSLLLWSVGVVAQQASLATDPGDDRTSLPLTVLQGTIRNDEGGPLVGVRVRIAVPAADMRFVHAMTSHTQFETRTVKNGAYRIEIPGIKEPTKISIDAMKPGYRRLVGTLMQGGDSKDLEIIPGTVTEASWVIKPALYFAGVVVDEKGEAISGVQVSANANSINASGGVERTASLPNGSFELFNYPIKSFRFGNNDTHGVVYFSHPDYLSTEIEDVYSIAESERKRIRIVLDSGHKISGRVVDAHGNPVSNSIVKVSLADGSHQKGKLTGADGTFILKGLASGDSVLRAAAFGIDQKQSLQITVDEDKNDIEIRLENIKLPNNLKSETILGMQLTDVTAELVRAYDLPPTGGALILDPGKDFERLDIGDLAKGFNLWMVGNTQVKSVREFVERILVEAGEQDQDDVSIRVVYGFFNVDSEGTNTQYLKLTKDDIRQLQLDLIRLANTSK